MDQSDALSRRSVLSAAALTVAMGATRKSQRAKPPKTVADTFTEVYPA